MLFPSFCFCGTTLVQMLQKGYKKLLRPVVVEQRVFLGGVCSSSSSNYYGVFSFSCYLANLGLKGIGFLFYFLINILL